MPNSGGLIDSAANRVLHTLKIDGSYHRLFMKYNYNIQKKLDMFRESSPEKAYKMIDRKNTDPNYIQKRAIG